MDYIKDVPWRKGLRHFDSNNFLYSDPDHIFRWVERNPDDLDRVLGKFSAQDCLVVGRTRQGLAAAPDRLRQTKEIVNHIFSLLTDDSWDLMMAVRCLSRSAAEYLVSNCNVNTLGNDVAWPLLLRKHGFKLDYEEADGLRYETNDVYVNDVEDVLSDDPAAWMLRVYAANQHMDAMRPYLQRA